MSEGGRPPAVFELLDVVTARTAGDVFGIWATNSVPSTEGVVFDATSSALTEAPVWRANLPADLDLAAAQMAGAEAMLHASQIGLAVAANRLDTFVEAQAGGLAFGTFSTGTVLARPEAELLVAVRQILEGRPVVSYGLGEELAEGWEQTTQRFQSYVDRLLKSIAHYTRVETHIQGQPLGRTTVSWTGDMNTVWPTGRSLAQVALHHRTLALALTSRDTLIRTLALAASGAVKIFVLLPMPGGAVLALPAAWTFINKVLVEVRKYRERTKATDVGG